MLAGPQPPAIDKELPGVAITAFSGLDGHYGRPYDGLSWLSSKITLLLP